MIYAEKKDADGRIWYRIAWDGSFGYVPCEIVDIEAAADEFLAWMEETGATEEMIDRARNAKSLESMVLEGNKLIYVRTGEAVAYYDAETGVLTDIESDMDIAKVDKAQNVVLPIRN